MYYLFNQHDQIITAAAAEHLQVLDRKLALYPGSYVAKISRSQTTATTVVYQTQGLQDL